MTRDDQPLLEKLGLALTPAEASPSPEEVAALHRAVARRFGGSRRAFWRRPIFALAAASLTLACIAVVVAFCTALPTSDRAIAEAVGLPVQAPAPTEASAEPPAAEAPRAFTPAKMPRTDPAISCEDDEDEQDEGEEPSNFVCANDDDDGPVCGGDDGEEPRRSDAAADDDDDDDDGDDAGFRVPDDDEHEGVPAAGPCPKDQDDGEDADEDEGEDE